MLTLDQSGLFRENVLLTKQRASVLLGSLTQGISLIILACDANTFSKVFTEFYLFWGAESENDI